MGILTYLTVALALLGPVIPMNYTERSLTYEAGTVQVTVTLEAAVLYPDDTVPVRVTFTALEDTGVASIGFFLEHIRSDDPDCSAVTDDSVDIRYICRLYGLTAGSSKSFELSGVPVGFIYHYAACDTIADYIGVPFRLVLEGKRYLDRQQVVTLYQSGYCAYLLGITAP